MDLQNSLHDFGSTAKDDAPQPGNENHNGVGCIYFMSCRDNFITSDSSRYVAVKIGLAHDGEQSMRKVMGNMPPLTQVIYISIICYQSTSAARLNHTYTVG